MKVAKAAGRGPMGRTPASFVFSALGLLASLSGCATVARSYTTSFPLTERPISENGAWINGRTVGLDWADVSTTPGLAMGTQTGTEARFKDATALLAGVWAPDQEAEATVYSVSQNDNWYQEVELRLRSSLSAHRSTGYEVLFRCSRTEDAYLQVVRWNGPLGDFTYLLDLHGAAYGVSDGDVVKATIVGDTISVFVNGAPMGTVSDDTFARGSPGMGFYLEKGTGTNDDYGFTRFRASEVRSPTR